MEVAEPLKGVAYITIPKVGHELNHLVLVIFLRSNLCFGMPPREGHFPEQQTSLSCEAERMLIRTLKGGDSPNLP